MEEKKVKIGEKYKCIASPRYTCFKIGDTYEIKDEFEAELISLFRDCFTLDKESEDEKLKRELTTFLINFNNEYYSKPSEDKIDSWIDWIDEKCEQKPTDEVKPKFKVGDWIVYEGLGTYKVVEIHEGWYSVIDSNDRRWSVMFERESLCHIWTIKDAKDGDILTVVNDERPFIFKGLLDIFHPECPVAYCGIDSTRTFSVSTAVGWWTDEKVQPATKEQRDILFQKMKEAGYEWDAEKKELIEIGKQSEQNEQNFWKKCNRCKYFDGYDICLHKKNFGSVTDVTKENCKNNGFFIEKQVEQKSVDKINTYCQENCKGYRDTGGKCFADGECEAKKKAEQKHVWSEEDKKELKVIIDELKKYVMFKQYGTPLSAYDISWLEELPSRFIIQPQTKKEWSEEDSERLLRIHQFIWANRKGDTDEIYQQEQDADWLMTLNPQKEWSEEDELNLNSFLHKLEVCDLLSNKEITWIKSKLKSIKPQQNKYDKGYNDGYSAAKYNHWKPSEEQMRVLQTAIKDYGICAEKNIFESLYNDLKNL